LANNLHTLNVNWQRARRVLWTIDNWQMTLIIGVSSENDRIY